MAYRGQTAPLIAYYQLQNQLRTVDGMAPIEEVARSIDGALQPRKSPAKKAAVAAKPVGKAPAAKPAGKKAASKPAKGKKAAAKVKAAKGKSLAKSPKKTASRKAATTKSKRPQRLTKRR